MPSWKNAPNSPTLAPDVSMPNKRVKTPMERAILRRRLKVAGVLAPLAVAASAVFWAGNKEVDHIWGLDSGNNPTTPQPKPEEPVKFVQFHVNGVGENSLSFAAAKFVPEEDQDKATDSIATYLPESDQRLKQIYPNEVVEFAINPDTGEVIPKDQLPASARESN